jgi:hypothetical protein
MQRRQLLKLSAGLALVHSPLIALANQITVRSLSDVQPWLDQLIQSQKAHTAQGWPLPAVLEHLAQSIEMSMDGFPEPNSALFQNTVGSAAFAVFKWRGKMSHSLTEAIPGAPALTQPGDKSASAARLRAAIARFESHTGALKPHFAYGNLNKTDYARAHSFHIANHQDEIRLA